MRLLQSSLLTAILSFLAVGTLLRAADAEIEKAAVEVTLVPDKAAIMLGEAIYLSFTVKNTTADDLEILVGGINENNLGRYEEFTVDVVGADGKPVPQPKIEWSMGGTSGPNRIPAGRPYPFRLFLPHWATFEHPGDYTITVKRTIGLRYPSKKAGAMEGWRKIPAEAKATIQVKASDPEEVGRVIAELGEKMLSETDRRNAPEASKRLKAIHDERVIPYFIKALKGSDEEVKYDAVDALATYDNDAALDALRDAMKTTGLDMGHVSKRELAEQLAGDFRFATAAALSRSAHPKALALLLEQRKDAYSGVRLTVVHALGDKMNAKEAIPLLKAMTSDPDRMVAGEAKRYLARFKLAEGK